MFFYVDVHGNNTGKHLQILDISVEMGKVDSNENPPKQNLHVVEEQHNTAVQPNKDKVTLFLFFLRLLHKSQQNFYPLLVCSRAVISLSSCHR